ncbi:MAG TPA: YceH family protein [Niabella sp.]|nr:YceH family protein [Niabella sp.]
MELNESQSLPVLDSEEIRVLGALMEKSKATPEYYPMTLNGLTAACNQKSSRNPVVNYDEQTVTLCLDRLKRKGLAATVTGGSSRVVKYRHTIALNYEFTPDALAILSLLFLRGPLTPGEINSNSGRLYEFDDLAEVHAVLERLSAAETPFVKQLERQPGQKEARYIHLFGDESIIESYVTEQVTVPAASSANNNLEERLAVVEQELAALKEAFEKLMKEWMG